MENPSVEVVIQNKGKAVLAQPNVGIMYAFLWSDPDTWSGEFPPLKYSAIHIPKSRNLIVDVDSTPRLSAVIVEGGLYFFPNS